ncbi:MAG TPA: C1 family peptidase [Solirubrobacteraceae bacterium]|jgi:C1A family cysteine protease|nr:C1 family peptidase [Solirubrobacteraceae bacterium]
MLSIEEVQKEIEAAAEADWEAGETSESALSDVAASARVGYVPGPGEPSLEEAEQIARAALEGGGEVAMAVGVPPGFDWRDVGGKNFVTPIKNQESCGSCVAFGSIAPVESLIRIKRNDPNYAADLSEAHLFFCYGPKAGAGRCPAGGWSPEPAYTSMKTGVVDEDCFPYTPVDQPCKLCTDWQNRLTKISGWNKPTTIPEIKNLLSTTGPATACFTVYEDFMHYKSGVYKHVAGRVVGGHCVCIVGYDDAQGCWIAKNSWGTGWGEGGFFRIAYGQCGIDNMMWVAGGIA